VTFSNGCLEREWSDMMERVGRGCTRVLVWLVMRGCGFGFDETQW